MSTLQSKSGQVYIGQALAIEEIVLDQLETPFLLLVNPSQSDASTVGVEYVNGETATIPVWAIKEMPLLIRKVTTSGTTALSSNLYAAK